MFRNGSEIFVSCSAISDDLGDSSSNSTIRYVLQLPKAHVFDRGPLRYNPKLGPTFVPQPFWFSWETEKVKITVIRRRRDSREVVRHAHRLDLTCRPFLNRAVKIEGSWPVRF
ncbi:hypothetical protein DY000_02037506 [Brassica cretica]|uniref:Uncharacterized protein n=1 Tax=Brassica cretica TaxID=69181 RepID=A0ABQ7B402_BRACR|nr:hypothetical protein DY000_02037506 [Brassica cretica]